MRGGRCAARIGTDCSPPYVWHLATPLNERNNEFFLLKGFTSTYLKETRFSFHAHFSWGPPPLGAIPENGHPQLAGPNRPSPVRPQTKSMATGLARDEIANDSRTGAVGRERFANGTPDRKLLLEVHESAALFTAGDLSLLK